MVRSGRSDEDIQAAMDISAMELLELRAELASGGTTLRWIIPNMRAAEKKRRGLLKWFARD